MAMITADQAMQMLNISRGTFYRLKKEKRINEYLGGGRYILYDSKEIEKIKNEPKNKINNN